jgi:hypothetical protein
MWRFHCIKNQATSLMLAAVKHNSRVAHFLNDKCTALTYWHWPKQEQIHLFWSFSCGWSIATKIRTKGQEMTKGQPWMQCYLQLCKIPWLHIFQMTNVQPWHSDTGPNKIKYTYSDPFGVKNSLQQKLEQKAKNWLKGSHECNDSCS